MTISLICDRIYSYAEQVPIGEKITGQQFGAMRLLFLDNNPDQLDLMRCRLEGISIIREVLYFQNDQEALVALTGQPGAFDGVVTDLRRDGPGTGERFIATLKKIDPIVPIAIITGELLTRQKTRALCNVGADFVFNRLALLTEDRLVALFIEIARLGQQRRDNQILL